MNRSRLMMAALSASLARIDEKVVDGDMPIEITPKHTDFDPNRIVLKPEGNGYQKKQRSKKHKRRGRWS